MIAVYVCSKASHCPSTPFDGGGRMAQLVVGLILLVVLMWMFEHYTAKRRCAYCGEVGRHKQDCPVDFEQR